MKDEDLAFTLVFAFSLVFLLFLLGNSVTGYLVQTMYCEDGVCKELCSSDSDCGAEICCDLGGFGACDTSCKKRFILSPEIETNFDINNLPHIESPSSTNNIKAYLAIMLIVLALGILYFVKGRKH
ncbi:hypothetical protein ACFLTH_14795 [Bacteroidota bacterium]